MRVSSAFVSLLVIVTLFATLTFPTGCANIIPPQGGPRDTIPPVLLKANPVDRATNVTSNRLVFSFDEFVELQNAQQAVIISPLPAVAPTLESKLKEVYVRLRDTLQPNTTYTIDFGSAIKDYNEGNVLKHFRFSFSTGDRLDSGRIKGKLVLAETGKTDTTLIVILHRSGKDSAIVTDRPAFITRINGKGEFQFDQLPDRDFYLYAIKDDGGMRRLIGDDQRVAFADSSVRPSNDPTPLTLYAFDLKAKTGSSVSPAPPIGTPGIKGRPGGGATDRRLRYTNSLSEGKQDLLSAFELSFDQALTRFDSSKIHLYTDTTFTPVKDHSFAIDSNRKKIMVQVPWKENTLYKLVVEKEALKDTQDRQLLKSDTISFTSRRRADYGKLSIRLRNPNNPPADGNTSNPVIQLVLNETIVATQPLGSDVIFRRELFLPGTYEIRVLYDRNQNGRWDGGRLFPSRLQPERVRLLDRKVTVKANWENEYEL
ncbi:MAG: Ig-like domain-containing protein [Bacteroidota bacterium]